MFKLVKLVANVLVSYGHMLCIIHFCNFRTVFKERNIPSAVSCIHTYIHTDRQTERQTERQTDRPTDRHMHHAYMHTNSLKGTLKNSTRFL